MNTAAVLEVALRVQSAQATTSLARFQGQLTATASKARTMDAVVDQQQRNLRALGTAAKYAAAGTAVLAGAGLYKVVKSGVEFNKTMESNRLALGRFVGSAKQTDKYLNRLFNIAKKTPFEFTDLTGAARRLMAFGLEAEKTERILRATGDAIAAMGGSAENIDRVTMALGQMQAKGKVSAEELLQLTEAGIPAYAILKKELGLTSDQVADIGNQGIKAGAAIEALTVGMEERFAGAAAEQARTFDGMTSTMRDNWAQMTGAMTSGLFEDMKKWAPEINRTMERITAVFNSKLSFEDKVLRSLQVVKRRLGPLVDDLLDKLDRADIGQKVLDAIEWAIPRVAERAGQMGIALAKGLVEGFAKADILGKLFIAGTFVRYLGGWGMFSTLGKKLGTPIGRGIGVGIIAGLLLMDEDIQRKVKKVLRDTSELVTGELLGGTSREKFAQNLQSLFDVGLGAIKFQGRDKVQVATEFGKLIFSTETEKVVKAKSKVLERFVGDSAEQIISAMGGRDMAEVWRTFMGDLDRAGKRAKDFGGDAEAGMKKVPRAARDALQAALRATEGGIGNISNVLEGTLRDYGVKNPSNFLHPVDRPGGTRGAGGPKTAQRGAFITGGKPSGDSIPAMLERGEYVLNRKAVAMLGKGTLDKINFGAVPRFQSGGGVNLSAPFNVDGAKPGFVPFMNYLNSLYGPIYVLSGLRPGSITTSGNVSNHASGSAVDISTQQNGLNLAQNAYDLDATGVAAKRMDALHSHMSKTFPLSSVSGDFLWRTFTGGNHFNHIHRGITNGLADSGRAMMDYIAKLPGGKAFGGGNVKLPRFASDFGLGTIAAQGLNLSAKALEQRANAALDARAMTPGYGTGKIQGIPHAGGTFSKAQLSTLWSATGKNGDPNTMAAIAMAESGGNASADNGIARGLWQIIESTWAAYGKGGWDNAFDPTMNAQAAHAILAGSGLTAWDVYDSGTYTQFLRRGGIAKLAGGGDGKDKPSLTVGDAKAIIPRKLARAIEALRRQTPRLEERVDTATTLAAFASSPAGSDLSVEERAGLVARNEALLGNLSDRARKLGRAIGLLPKSAQKRGFSAELAELQGVTGKGGSILTVRTTLDELGAPVVAEADTQRAQELADLLSAQNLDLARENTVLRSQMPVFNRLAGAFGPFAGTFHDGGTIPGPVGAPRMAAVQAGETVSPIGAAPVIQVTLADPVLAALNPHISATVDGKLATVVRKARPTGGVTGRKANFGA